jgi:hypothetical protein
MTSRLWRLYNTRVRKRDAPISFCSQFCYIIQGSENAVVVLPHQNSLASGLNQVLQVFVCVTCVPELIAGVVCRGVA